jgi:hypothetical protein
VGVSARPFGGRRPGRRARWFVAEIAELVELPDDDIT